MDIDAVAESSKVDILFVAANARSLVSNRGELIKELTGRGFNVAALVPSYDYSSEVDSLGIEITQYDLDRHSLNPFKFIYQFFLLVKVMREISPSSVFCYAVKPIVLGAMAARMTGVKNVFCLVTGLGYAFCADGIKPLLIRQISRGLYGFASLLSSVFIFQNDDDKRELEKGWLFRLSGALGRERLVVPGSGVDVDDYPFCEVDLSHYSFVCTARLIKEKGVFEYAEAARIVKESHPDVNFYLAGALDENLVSSVSRKDVEKWQDTFGVTYLGKVDDVKGVIENSTFFVLPSYREGTSRSILEAMSMGRPVITTDVPGCNGPVLDGVNGIVVKPKDARALAAAMIEVMQDEARIQSMSKASRERAVSIYDVRKVNATMFGSLKKYLS